ncbi:hypothetical protein Amn_23560 [Aminobacter sp. Y103A]|nr:hypothetical protein Amn_23560 [Aminobacter sp. SS-2016]
MSEVEGGRWRAEVWPGSRGEYPVAFFVIDGPSPLAGLVADYRWKEAEDEQLYAEYCELLTATVLPRVAVKIGHRRVVDPETGAPSWDQWTAETPEDIDRYLKAGISVEVDQERAAAITNLQDLQVAHDRAWESSGLAAAERATEAAYDAKYRARQEVFAYRPATLAEVSSKNEFLAELLGSGFQFSPEDLGAVFGQK